MQRILSGLGITGSQVMLASGCRAALPVAAATSVSAAAAMADFKSGNRSRNSAPRSTASAPSMRPQLVVPLILKLANFIGYPECSSGLALEKIVPHSRCAFRYRMEGPQAMPKRQAGSRMREISGRDVDIAANTRADIGERGRASTQQGVNHGLLGIEAGLQQRGCDLRLCI